MTERSDFSKLAEISFELERKNRRLFERAKEIFDLLVEAHDSMVISCNSGVPITDPQLVERVAACINKHGTKPDEPSIQTKSSDLEGEGEGGEDSGSP